ncbi:hypothetical protein M407DRAFT_32732 [Tulasnella calospora MUT 4182]|uniref:Uncharacterized protein n=1 Tax=Tulasnella calospora MUT 4182 TaxID=1051891 RepID=A0A0C3Q482_9AGAM|nr:hypothetical protein M407DRAFT_32732 [Tulasnella calospora MUT 4182]
MNAIIENPLNPTGLEIPDPPEEFGQDGGKFYHAYDALAGEIDEDMTTSRSSELKRVQEFRRNMQVWHVAPSLPVGLQ